MTDGDIFRNAGFSEAVWRAVTFSLLPLYVDSCDTNYFFKLQSAQERRLKAVHECT